MIGLGRPFSCDSLYDRLAEPAEIDAEPGHGRTNMTATIETTDESASPLEPIVDPRP